jgi:cell division control protein 6
MSLFDGLSPLFKNHKVFQLDYDPPKISNRNENMKAIAAALTMRRNHLIHGPTGTGKTAACKHVLNQYQEEISDALPVVRIYIKDNSTLRKVLMQIYSKVNGSHIPRRIDSEILFQRLQGQEFYLVIDEFEKLGNKEFSALVKYLEALKAPAIFLTNDPSFNMGLAAEITNRLAWSINYFKPYTVDELYEILFTRAKEGLIDSSFDEDIIRYVAAMSMKDMTHGDARHAIQVLYESASQTMREGISKISKTHVNNAVAIIRNKTAAEAVYSLGTDHRLIMLSVRDRRTNTGDLYREYSALARDTGNHVSSYTTFYRRLQELDEKFNYLALVESTKGQQGGRTRSVHMKVPITFFKEIEPALANSLGISNIDLFIPSQKQLTKEEKIDLGGVD